MLLMDLLIFLKTNFSEKFFQKYHQSVKQFASIWVQTVCKDFQQAKQVGNELNGFFEKCNVYSTTKESHRSLFWAILEK